MGKISEHMAWGHLAWATIFFSGLTVVLLGGAQEIAQNNGGPFGVTLALVGAAASAGFLAFLYWLNWRAAKRRAGIGVIALGKRVPGGFWRYFLSALAVVVLIRAAVFFLAAAGVGAVATANVVLTIVPGALLYTGVPLAAGIVGHLIRATAPTLRAAAR